MILMLVSMSTRLWLVRFWTFMQDYFRDPEVGFRCQPNPYALQAFGLFQIFKKLEYIRLLKILKNPISLRERIFLSGWQDSNLRPPAPKAGAITGLRYTPRA